MSNNYAQISSQELKEAIREEILKAAENDAEISLKNLRAKLEKNFSQSLLTRVPEIRDLLHKVIEECELDGTESEEDGEEEDDFFNDDQMNHNNNNNFNENVNQNDNNRKRNRKSASPSPKKEIVKKPAKYSKQTKMQAITRKEFFDNVNKIEIDSKDLHEDKKIEIPAKSFSTGGCGWFANGKFEVPLNGEEDCEKVYCQYQYVFFYLF